MTRVREAPNYQQLVLGMAIQVSVKRAAELLEVSPQHVRYLVRTGKIKGSREAGPLVVDLDTVLKYKGTRGVWQPHGVAGGKSALKRMGLTYGKGVV